MTEELSGTLAETIRTADEAVNAAVEVARLSVDAALEKAAEAGVLVEEAKSIHHSHFPQWLRENVPSVAIETAEKYHSIHKVRRRRQCQTIDHNQMKLIGITGDEQAPSHSSTAQRADHSRWVKWVGHVVHHFKDVEETTPIEKMEDFERKALADSLEPLVKLWGRAKGVSI